jgi:hypothetical protein
MRESARPVQGAGARGDGQVLAVEGAFRAAGAQGHPGGWGTGVRGDGGQHGPAGWSRQAPGARAGEGPQVQRWAVAGALRGAGWSNRGVRQRLGRDETSTRSPRCRTRKNPVGTACGSGKTERSPCITAVKLPSGPGTAPRRPQPLSPSGRKGRPLGPVSHRRDPHAGSGWVADGGEPGDERVATGDLLGPVARYRTGAPLHLDADFRPVLSTIMGWAGRRVAP